jgi:hypothetical protein
MPNQRSLDPHKSPWQRGDVVTLGFKKVGFVLSRTPEYLEVRWNKPDGIERVATADVDGVLRIAHAEGASLSETGRTNLQSLEALESLQRISDAISNRMKTIKTDRDNEEANELVKRIFAKNKCSWDRRNEYQLLRSFTHPEDVGLLFKLQDRLHQLFCRAHGAAPSAGSSGGSAPNGSN